MIDIFTLMNYSLVQFIEKKDVVLFQVLNYITEIMRLIYYGMQIFYVLYTLDMINIDRQLIP